MRKISFQLAWEESLPMVPRTGQSSSISWVVSSLQETSLVCILINTTNRDITSNQASLGAHFLTNTAKKSLRQPFILSYLSHYMPKNNYTVIIMYGYPLFHYRLNCGSFLRSSSNQKALSLEKRSCVLSCNAAITWELRSTEEMASCKVSIRLSVYRWSL